MSHPSPQLLQDLLDDRLSEEQSQAIDAHLQSCEACKSRFEQLAKGNDFGLFAPRLRQSSSEPPAPPEIPRYEVLRHLGSGGMGAVFLAHDKELSREVALKIIGVGPWAEAALARFATESESIAHLQHPNIVQVFDRGEHDGVSYFTMDYVEGESLADALRRGPLPPREAAGLLRVIADAVQHAHDRGVIHRDLKPSNIMLAAPRDDDSLPWRPVIVDFGIARRPAGDQGNTQTGEVLGSPEYMSPEQAKGQKVSQAADIYGLGAVLYVMLTARPPFQAADPAATIRQVQFGVLPRPRSINSQIPVELDTIAQKCLEKKPSSRYASAGDVKDEIERYLAGRRIKARHYGPLKRFSKFAWRNKIAFSVTLLAIVAVMITFYADWQRRESNRAARDFHLSEATRFRTSGEEGQRFRCLQELRQVLAARSYSDVAMFEKIRTEAVAALVLADVELDRLLTDDPDAAIAIDESFARFAHAQGRFVLIKPVNQGETDGDTADTISLSTDFERISHLQFSRDSRFILVANDAAGVRECELQLLEIGSGRSVFPEPLRTGDTTWAFGNNVLATMPARGSLRLHNLTRSGADAVAGETIAFQQFQYGCMAFNPKGDTLAALKARPSEVLIWDVKTQQVSHKLPQKTSSPHDDTHASAIAWSRDGTRLAAATRYSINVWDVVRRQRLAVFDVGDTDVAQLCFNQRGDVLAACGDSGAVNLWSIRSQRHLLRTRGKACLRFNADDSRLAGAPTASGVGIWRVEFGREYQQLHGTLVRHNSSTYVDFDHTGRFLLTSSLDGVKLWDCSGEVAQPLQQLSRRCEHARFDTDGASVLANSNSNVFYWRVESSDLLSQAIEPVGQLDLVPYQPTTWAGTFDLSRDGSVLAVSLPRNDRIVVFDLRMDQRTVLPLRGDTNSLSLSPDGRLLAASSVDGMKIWDTSTGAVLRTLDVPDANAAFDPSGRALITGSRTHYTLWNTTDWTQRWDIEREGRLALGRAAFTEDGRMVALAGTGSVMLVRVVDGRPITRLTPPDPLVISDLVIAPDERWLAAACNDHVIQLWNLEAIRQQLDDLDVGWQASRSNTPPIARPHPLPSGFAPYDGTKGRPTIRIKSPVGGRFNVGEFLTIEADASDEDGLSHNQYLLYDGEQHVGMIYDSAQNSGFRGRFVWKIPAVLDQQVLDGDNYRIKAAVWDASPRYLATGAFSPTFSIHPAEPPSSGKGR